MHDGGELVGLRFVLVIMLCNTPRQGESSLTSTLLCLIQFDEWPCET